MAAISLLVSVRHARCMKHQHLILTGIPASGKSTIGRALSNALGLEMWDKDDILEHLFNEKGIGDLHWRSVLSRAADEILMNHVCQSDGSVVVSWWRHPASSLASGTPIEWLSELRGSLIEVNCVCDPVVAAERFKSRTRHSGHQDQSRAYEELLTTFQQQAALGPLGIGRLITVNTEGEVKIEDLLHKIGSLA
jgi:predicted kinase